MKPVAALVLGVLLLAEGAEARQARPRPMPFVVQADGLFRATTSTFDDRATPTIHAEPARIGVDYDVPRAVGFSLAGFRRVWKQLSVGASVGRISHEPAANITASLPHPFLFSRNREIEGTASTSRSETSIAILARYDLPTRTRLGIALYAGPAWLAVNQEFVDMVNFDEAYPYDTASYRSATLVKSDRRKVGISMAADATYFLSRQVGVGFGLKYSRAAAELDAMGSAPVKMTLGGVDITGGMRVRF